MNDVKDFFTAALPWICMGLLLAIFFAKSSRKKKGKESKENYGTEGMALGMCFGTAIVGVDAHKPEHMLDVERYLRARAYLESLNVKVIEEL